MLIGACLDSYVPEKIDLVLMEVVSNLLPLRITITVQTVRAS